MHSNLPPKGKWFIKHLNWTVVLWGWLLAYPIIGISAVLEPSTVSTEDTAFNILVIVCVLYILGEWYLMIWNLRHKDRSVFNLLYLFLPFGSIIFLCINNREQLEYERRATEQREKEDNEYWKEHGGKPGNSMMGY